MATRKLRPAAALLCILLLVGCGMSEDEGKGSDGGASSEEVKKEVGEALDATRAYLVGEADKLRERLQTQMDAIDRGIEELKEKSAAAGEKGREYRDRALDALEEKNIAARRRLEEFRRSSGEFRREAAAKLEQAIEELEEAYERAQESFGKEGQ